MQNSLCLSAKNDVSLTQNDVNSEKTVTTRELAKELGTSPKVILENARKCLPCKKIENGKQTFWNEVEVTMLVEQMKTSNPNQNTFTEAVKAVSTELTPGHKTMSVKEVAEVFGVTPEAIKKHIRTLYPDIIQNGKETRLNEKQVTEIKSKMIPTTRVVGAVTELEKQETIIKAMQYLQEGYAVMKQRAELAEKSLDRIANGKGCYSMNQTAKALKLPYGNITLFEKLRSMQILNLDNTPKQEQINSGNFKVVVKFVNEKVGNKAVTLTTGKGLLYLARKFNTDIDESVKADM